MTEAPSKLWLDLSREVPLNGDNPVGYVRADIADAMLAALKDVDDSDGQRLGLVRAAMAEYEGEAK